MPPRGASSATTNTDPAKLLPPILRHLQATPPDGYSAHQKARTTAARLVHAKKYAEAQEVLFVSAKELLKVGESGSGCDLACYLVQVYGQADVEVTSESRARLTQLLALLSAQGNWRKKLADSAIKWSSEHGDSPLGDPDLHQYIGQLYYKDRQYPQAELHLVASCKRDAAITLADMMWDWSGKGKAKVQGGQEEVEEDIGAYAGRVVVPWLSVNPPAILPARTFLKRFIELVAASDASFISTTVSAPSSNEASSTEGEFRVTTSSTINFLQLALATIQRAPPVGSSGVQARGERGGVPREWDTLVRRYRGSGGAMSSEAMHEALLHTSTNTFLIPPPRGAVGGADMLQSLMGSLFGGGGGGGGGGPQRVGQ